MMDISVESLLYKKTLGSLIGDVIGTPKEDMAYWDIEAKFGWVDDFETDGADDTVIKNILADAIVKIGGYATIAGLGAGVGRAVRRDFRGTSWKIVFSRC